MQYSGYDADVEDVDACTAPHPTATVDDEQANSSLHTRDAPVHDLPAETESTTPKQQSKFIQVNRTCKNCKCHKREKEKMKKRGQRLEKKLAKMENELVFLKQVSCHFVISVKI